MKNIGILKFIEMLRYSDDYIEEIYKNGGCYQFHLILKELYSESIPYMCGQDHIVTFYKGRFYDITGELPDEAGNEYRVMTKYDEILAIKWSFHEHMSLKLTECEVCGEPIAV